eukprot:752844-Hanusia_phi.AAC.3
MEYAAKGDLGRIFEDHKLRKLHVQEHFLWRVLCELSLALHHLHSNRIIHRDIKIVNVFLDHNNTIKLGDLGVSRVLEGEEEMAQSRVGTPLYLAPELIRRQPYHFKADVWALGVLMYTMAALRGPFVGDNIYVLGESILHEEPKALPDLYSRSLRDLIRSMLLKDPSARPSVIPCCLELPPPCPSSQPLASFSDCILP